MPKLTVFTKKETGTQEGIDSLPEESSLFIQKKELLKINLFDTEKTDKNKSDKAHYKSLAQKFNEYLIQSVDEALTTLGEPVKNTVYFQLENNFNIPKKEIPDQIKEFTDIMHKIFGLGSSRLEIRFMNNLNSKIKVSVETKGVEWPFSKRIVDDMSFTEYIRRTREKYCSCNKNTEQPQKTEVQDN
jgi:hypothetical protein